MAVADSTERKYVLTKLAPGDYLLPSNDRKTIWRLMTYTEGPSSGLEDWPQDVQMWALWRWTGHKPPATVDDCDDMNLWEHVEGMFPKRKDAIKEAMRLE